MIMKIEFDFQFVEVSNLVYEMFIAYLALVYFVGSIYFN